jgi:hypothetical protein
MSTRSGVYDAHHQLPKGKLDLPKFDQGYSNYMIEEISLEIIHQNQLRLKDERKAKNLKSNNKNVKP